MYLKRIKLQNFRKFGENNNIIDFVSSKDYSFQDTDSTDNNIALATTLIVGKNNTGKTTITTALQKIVSGKDHFAATDFNFRYLSKILDFYIKGDSDNYLCPFIEFNLEIGINDESKDSTVNIKEFLTIENVNFSSVKIIIRYELVEQSIFTSGVESLIDNYKFTDKSFLLSKFLDFIEQTPFKMTYFNNANEEISGFSIKNLIELKIIEANNIKSENDLSKSFNKIISYKNKNLNQELQKNIDKEIISINNKIDDKVYRSHTKDLNQIVNKVDNHVKVDLQSNITINSILNDLGRYRYIEEDYYIPEKQFGLGYTNLMKIIAEIIDYVEKYPNDCLYSKINLISIEEPETFMHPQMQERFIENINNAIVEILNGKLKILNCQMIITTHSSHILNSKINMGNTFNNINYFTDIENYTTAINLTDDKINPNYFYLKQKLAKENETKNKEIEKQFNLEKKNLEFIKKHIKYKVSELFFSDAVILCEGITEESLLKYYINNDDKLNRYYISIFNIDGAHGKIYIELLKTLKVPSLIITDLDIKKNSDEKKEIERKIYPQCTSLKGRTTTNETLKFFYPTEIDDLDNLPYKYEFNNIKVVYQRKMINRYYATSFEEAFILSNSDNSILKKVLCDIKPRIFSSISSGNDSDSNSINNNSFMWQYKLAKAKTEFANSLLYEMMSGNDNPILPAYIQEGLDWIENQLGRSK